MTDVSEPTLFDDECTGQPMIDVDALVAATEHRLDAESSITLVRGLVPAHRRLLSELMVLDGWQRRQRWMYDRHVDEPRLTNEYRDLSDAPSTLVEMAAVLSRHCGIEYDGIWMNWYRDNHDSTGWHADRPANEAATAAVPVVSLGATRRFLIRPAEGGPSTAFTLDGGDALVMRGRCQRDWRHCVPKQRAPAGSRISLNFTSALQASRPVDVRRRRS
jgi:alkylated DNA repair dioxygenase AlkB